MQHHSGLAVRRSGLKQTSATAGQGETKSTLLPFIEGSISAKSYTKSLDAHSCNPHNNPIK